MTFTQKSGSISSCFRWCVEPRVSFGVMYSRRVIPCIISRLVQAILKLSDTVLVQHFYKAIVRLSDTLLACFKPHHQFFIGRPGTTEDEVKGSEGTAGVKSKTTVMNTDEFIKAVGSFFGAMSSTHRSFNPRVMVNTIFTNNDRKRKRESEGKGNSDATASSKVKAKKLRKVLPLSGFPQHHLLQLRCQRLVVKNLSQT